MVEVLGRVVQALALLALPALALALVRSLRSAPTVRSDPAGRPVTDVVVRQQNRPGLLARGVVAVVLLVGIVAGLVASAGPQVPWVVVAALVLTAVLLRRDERFWVGLATLLPLHALLSGVAVLVLGRGYLTSDGGWSGVDLLIAWAGPVGSPAAAHHGAAVVALSVLRLGLPLAVTSALGWVLATRLSMGLATRGALLVTTAALLGQVLVGPARVAVAVSQGLAGSLPFRVAVIGLLVGIVLVLTVVPGAVLGLLVGTTRLVRRRRDGVPDTAPVTTLGRGVGSVLRSLRHHVRGPRRWASRVAIVLSVLGVLVIGGLDLSYGLVLDDPGRAPVQYVAVDRELPVPGGVLRVVPGPGAVAWLLTRDGRLATFDPATDEVRTGPLRVDDARSLGSGGAGVAVLTRESRPRVVVYTSPTASTTAVTLDAGSRPSIAATATRLYAAQSTGDVVVLDASGKTLGEKRIQPLDRVVTVGAEVWSLHLPAAVAVKGKPVATSALVAIRRDPTTLVELGRETVSRSGTALVWDDSGRGYDLATGVSRPPRVVVPPTTSGTATPPATAAKPVAAARWTPGPRGTVVLAVGTARTRFALPYDRVLSVIESPTGTWLVVAEDGVPLTPRADDRGLVVRWVDPPGPPAVVPTPKPATSKPATSKPATSG